ncbi:hypothetical protein AKJ09_02823 [Labilithrix luteola]|uniref:Uncharacterized protein n=1 Tax=Labilithrix luteola TaxID=1391654 RepID=A0A0K1PSQ6_9BACT|nr:hypothetical protein [Labilithrix luteola]AKU96159.1 hypothetical protein AKJ09_02823 [Labilithrix luteola]
MSTSKEPCSERTTTLVAEEAQHMLELALAYRIATHRVQSSADVERLTAYELTAGRLASSLEEAIGKPRCACARTDKGWLEVGAITTERGVFEFMRTLEARRSERLAWLAKVVGSSGELHPLLSRAACASEVRQAWLTERGKQRPTQRSPSLPAIA